MRYIKLFAEQCKLSVMSAAIYRVNFWLMLFQSILNAAIGLLCIQFIYGSVDSIAGWDRAEMLILVSTAQIVNQLYRNIMHWNQNRFLYGIGSGGLDKMLLRPVNLIFQANTGRIDISGLISIAAPLVVLVINISAAGASVSLIGIGLYVLFMLNGVLVLSSFILLLYTSAFIFIRVDGVHNIYYALMDIAEKPREMFTHNLFLGFIFLIPAMPLANAPAAVLLGRADLRLMLVYLGMGVLFSVACYVAVRFGLTRYSSASS